MSSLSTIYILLKMPASPSTSTRRASNHEMEDLIPIDKVVILYASETGNSQDTAERVGREFRRYGKRCTVMSMELFDVVSLEPLDEEQHD